MRVLITGSNGLLGQKLLHKLRVDKTVELIATSLGENIVSEKNGYTYFDLDITNENAVSKIILEQKPDVVINTAAMTDVDLCEDKKKKTKFIIFKFQIFKISNYQISNVQNFNLLNFKFHNFEFQNFNFSNFKILNFQISNFQKFIISKFQIS